LNRFSQIVEGIASALGCEVEITVKSLTPAVNNNKPLAAQLADLVKVVKPELDIATDFHTMVSEDMAFFLDTVPGVFIFVGSANVEKGLTFSHHHPQFDIDEQSMVTTAAVLAAAALDYLKE